jgi:nucleoside phosphorylase
MGNTRKSNETGASRKQHRQKRILTKLSSTAEIMRERGANLLPPSRTQIVQSAHHVDIGIVVALKEEFAAIASVLPKSMSSLPAEEHGCCAACAFELEAKGGPALRCFMLVMDEPGELEAAFVTWRLLNTYGPKVVVSIGISGSLDHKGVLLGDVVIAESVNRYFANSKAIPGADDELLFDLGGRSESCKGHHKFVSGLSIHQSDLYHEWQAEGTKDFSDLITHCNDPAIRSELQDLLANARLRHEPEVISRPCASGPTVIGSDAFRNAVLRLNRKFGSADMESGGVLAAIVEFPYDVEWARPQTLIIRGISDFAGDNKSPLEERSGNAIRGLAMRNALRLFFKCVKAGMISSDTKDPVGSS